MAYRGAFDYSADKTDDGLPSHIYYNASIINNNTGDFDTTGVAIQNPHIRFNETRDTALVQDASKYNYSIVRFQMNGPNLTLPLFIPNIAVGTTANPLLNVNLTTYTVSITYSQSWRVNIPTNGGLQTVNFECTPTPTALIYVPESQNRLLCPIPQPPTIQQDLSSPYYFCYSYQTVITMINTALTTAFQAAYDEFQRQWLSAASEGAKPPGQITTAFPYSGFNTGASPFMNDVYPPQFVFQSGSELISLYGDSMCFGPRIMTFVPSAVEGRPASPPICRLFGNNNTYGLFSNFPTTYWNKTQITGFTYPVQQGYVWEYLFINKFFTNVAAYGATPPQGGSGAAYAPPGGNPATAPGYNGSLNPPGSPAATASMSVQKPFWIMTQDYTSTSTLWSPIASIVFTTTLMPIRSEATGVPIILGSNNLGNSSPSNQSAFVNSITDIAIDLSSDGADAYRRFIYYAPNAEYRISDLANSKLDIRTIDVQVFWKHRLNNQLYPITMFNLSSVDFKMMFRHKRVMGI
jgi:hypothetical protein